MISTPFSIIFYFMFNEVPRASHHLPIPRNSRHEVGRVHGISRHSPIVAVRCNAAGVKRRGCQTHSANARDTGVCWRARAEGAALTCLHGRVFERTFLFRELRS